MGWGGGEARKLFFPAEEVGSRSRRWERDWEPLLESGQSELGRRGFSPLQELAWGPLV